MIWVAIGLVVFLMIFSWGNMEIRFSILVLGGICLFLFRRIRALEQQLREQLSSAADTLKSAETKDRADATPPAAPSSSQSEHADLIHSFDIPPPPPSPADLSADTPPSDADPLSVISAEHPTPDPEPATDATIHTKSFPISPGRPSFFDRTLSQAWTWLKTGNPVVKVGLVILLLGISFLLKYAAAHSLFPPELRAASAGLLGVVLLFFGWRHRETRRAFALLIQGGGIATLYLTIFAVTRFLGLLSPAWALALMTAMVVFSVILAILQNSVWLAVFGWSGGFLAPILLSTGTGSHVHLFSYYVLLNAGLLGVSAFRNWRILNLLGFFCTFGIGSAWGLSYYKPDFFATTQPFLILFFLMYAVISILFARSGKDKKEARLDSMLVFGLPLVVFSLQIGLVHNMEMGAAYSSLALSIWYLGTVKFLWKGEKHLHLLAETHIGLGIVFLSLAVPMALDATATASTWALEGAGMVFLGLRQNRLTSRIFGLLLQIAAAISFFMTTDYGVDTGQLLAGLFLGIGGWVSSWAYCMFKKDLRPWESLFDPICGLWGGVFGYGIWWAWCGYQIFWHQDALLLMGIICFHLVWSLLLWRNTIWKIPVYGAQLFIVFLLLIACARPSGHPSANWGWILWPAALLVHFASLYGFEKKWLPLRVMLIHGGSILLVVFLLTSETRWLTQHLVGSFSWTHTLPAVMAGLLMVLTARPPAFLSWPLGVHQTACMGAGGVIGIFLTLWWTGSYTLAGNPEPLAYVPVLNILDLGQALILACVAMWLHQANETFSFYTKNIGRFLGPGLTGAIFIWINGVITRIAHFWGGVAYTSHGIFQSEGLQAAYSVLWSLMAVIAMVYSHRHLHRKIWMTGAGLLGLVVVKLFFVDLSGHGTVARIVSFLCVGILMLVVGYMCPLPPKEIKK
ncbi:DUF2339 domain-containing protein [Desulfosarcina sp. OttesenSCG-928-A07]|nr:DUF2339 domain-containing protein [Desulfosarcina sp. OttesenSCG-928-A07]